VALLFLGGAVRQVQTVFSSGSLHTSPGGQYTYRVLGPCCRLFDREELPWPCCRLAWRGKEPSWRRIGRRFVPDLASRRCPWYSKLPASLDPANQRPPSSHEKSAPEGALGS
jgi:hypothetical protein